MRSEIVELPVLDVANSEPHERAFDRDSNAVEFIAELLRFLSAGCGSDRDVRDVREIQPKVRPQSPCVQAVVKQRDLGVAFVWNQEDIGDFALIVVAEHGVLAREVDWPRRSRHGCDMTRVFVQSERGATKDEGEVSLNPLVARRVMPPAELGYEGACARGELRVANSQKPRHAMAWFVKPNVRAKLPAEAGAVSLVRDDAPCAADQACSACRSGSA